jgi:hypothetical protein
VPVTKQPLDPRPIITHYKHFAIKNSSYYSKPMTVFPHETVYHVIRCNLVFTVFYMHVFIILSFNYLVINHTFSQIASTIIKWHFMVVINMYVLIHKIFLLCKKIIIISIHVSFTHLYRTTPLTNLFEAQQPRNLRKT